MELERGVPTLLERPEVKHEVWLEPGMLRGEGAREERCWRIRLRFFTVWKTRFGCSLQTWPTWSWWMTFRLLQMINIWIRSYCGGKKKKKKRICTSALLRLDHPFGVPSSWCPLFLLPVSPGEETNCYLGTEDVVMQTDSLSSNYVHFFCIVKTLKNLTPSLTIGNRPREWKRLAVLSGRVLFLRFFSSSWASCSISIHSAYLSCNSCN